LDGGYTLLGLYPLATADICTTVLKKICRRHGLKRWPSRRLKSIDKQVALLRTVTDNERFDGARALTLN
jgi:hypothetical protein